MIIKILDGSTGGTEEGWAGKIKPTRGLIDFDQHQISAQGEMFILAQKMDERLERRSEQSGPRDYRTYGERSRNFREYTEEYAARILQGWALDPKRFDLEAYKNKTSHDKERLTKKLQDMGAEPEEITKFFRIISNKVLDEITPHL